MPSIRMATISSSTLHITNGIILGCCSPFTNVKYSGHFSIIIPKSGIMLNKYSWIQLNTKYVRWPLLMCSVFSSQVIPSKHQLCVASFPNKHHNQLWIFTTFNYEVFNTRCAANTVCGKLHNTSGVAVQNVWSFYPYFCLFCYHSVNSFPYR